MAFGITWYWNSGDDDSPTWTAFGTDDIIKMVGGVYSTPVPVNHYQNGMHLQTSSSTDTDACASPHLSNLKYLETDKAEIRGDYSDILDSNFPATTMCLKAVVTDADSPTSFTTSNGGLFFYDGTTPATAPTNLTVQGLEQGDSGWTSCGGSSNAVSIDDKTASDTSQSFYFGISALPTSTGSLSATLRFTVDYDTGGGATTLTSDVDIELEATYCDAVNTNHVINYIVPSDMRPTIKELSSRSKTNFYGSTSSTTYGTPRQIVGIVIPDTGYYSKGMQQYGITTSATPALLVPITCEYSIGSRVYDKITEAWYEIVEESDVIKHFNASLSQEVNYREYSLQKVQGNDI